VDTSAALPDPSLDLRGGKGQDKEQDVWMEGREDGERGREGMTGPRISKYGYTCMPIGVRRSGVDAVV